MNFKIVTAVSFAFLGIVAMAEDGRWSLSAGPAWRSGVKMQIRGNPAFSGGSSSFTRSWNKNMDQSPSALDVSENKPSPEAAYGGTPNVWAATAIRTDVTTTSGSFDASERENGTGLNLQAGYDFYQGEQFAFGLNLRFAGYWNMRSSFCGGSGSVRTATYKDYFLYSPYSCTGDRDADLPTWARPDASPCYDYSENQTDVTSGGGAAMSNVRLRSDLYQVGLGPKATWHALDWLDVYAGVDVLLNIARSKLDDGEWSSSQTDCLIGFGGNVGLVGKITENLGLYAQVGYEWVDKEDLSCRGYNAEIDYSSIVVSAGVKISF